MTEFQTDVTKAIKTITAGETVSYSELAAMSGHPGAHRAVASMMKKNWQESIPCHRVVHSDGWVGKYNREGGTDEKVARLQAEGVNILDGKVQDKKYSNK